MQELKICVYKTDLGDRVGSVAGARVYDLNLCCVQQLTSDNKTLESYRLANTLVPHDLASFLSGGDSVLAAARHALEWVLQEGLVEGPAGEPLSHAANDVKLQAPILPSTKVICMMMTYPDHIQTYQQEINDEEETGETTSVGALPHTYPHYFVKMSQVVVGPEEWVILPKHHPEPVVYGTELTVVIGKKARIVPEDEAMDHVWGYTILNDLTLLGRYNPNHKVFDTCAPTGPWIVPADQIVDPGNLDFGFRLNGETVQKANTGRLKFSIASIIAEVSKWLTLNPGDIIATGDVGTTVPLKPGDIMEAEIGMIGTLRNPVKLEE